MVEWHTACILLNDGHDLSLLKVYFARLLTCEVIQSCIGVRAGRPRYNRCCAEAPKEQEPDECHTNRKPHRNSSAL